MSLYSPLQHKRDIRLLRIQPASRISTLSVTFEVYSLDSDVQFTAVSYVWGSPTPPSWIKCNGHDVSITGNLWDVLSQLQDKSHDGLVWADAICINQSDNEEKGVQVSMMRDIYKRAANVILWLGKEEQHDRHAIRLMELFCGKHGYVANLEPRREWTLGELSLPSIDCGWMGWASLLSRPWFGRIWVVQEFLNATQSIFMSGSLGIPTALLIRCAEATATCAHIGAVVISSTANHVNMRPILLRSFAICAHQTASSIAINDVRIFDLWTRSQLLEASDPRDRVFGLLSTQTAVGMNIVDYSKTVETVYMDIARIALTMPVPATDYHRTSPCALPPGPWGSAPQRVSRFLACRTQTSHSSGLPSWVPDWRPAGFTFVPLTRYYPGSAYFTHAYQHATIFGKTMSISGIIVDKPHVIIDSTPYMEVDSSIVAGGVNTGKLGQWFGKMWKWLMMCRLLSETASSFATKYDLAEAFCRTMAFNALTNKSQTPRAEYIACLQTLHNNLAYGAGKISNRLTRPRYMKPATQGIIYESVFHTLSVGRKFCVTSKGSMAWVPQSTRLGDSICFLAGCAVPFVTRSVGESFELLGDCYLHSICSDESITFDTKPSLLQFQ